MSFGVAAIDIVGLVAAASAALSMAMQVQIASPEFKSLEIEVKSLQETLKAVSETCGEVEQKSQGTALSLNLAQLEDGVWMKLHDVLEGIQRYPPRQVSRVPWQKQRYLWFRDKLQSHLSNLLRQELGPDEKADVCHNARHLVTEVLQRLQHCRKNSVRVMDVAGSTAHLRASSSWHLPRFLECPTPIEFLVACVIFCVSVTYLYHRRPLDRYKNLILGMMIAIVSTIACVAGEDFQSIVFQYLPSTILCGLFVSECGHRLILASGQNQIVSTVDEEKRFLPVSDLEKEDKGNSVGYGVWSVSN